MFKRAEICFDFSYIAGKDIIRNFVKLVGGAPNLAPLMAVSQKMNQ